MPEDSQGGLKEATRLYAAYFSARNAEAIAGLLCDDATLFDPGEKMIAGKAAILTFLDKIFALDDRFDCVVRNVWAEEATTILEFRLTIGTTVLEGVDLIEWRDGRIAVIRAYVNAN